MPVRSRGGPELLRILLGSQLRQLRESRGITRRAAGNAIRASRGRISRLELGQVGSKERDVADLLSLYGVADGQEHETFLALARQANIPGWWQRYSRVVPSWFEPLIGLEQAATVIHTYEVQFVPGLLQTADYARAVIRLGHPWATEQEIDWRVGLRMRRQELLTLPDAPKLRAVVDEAALRRPLGGTDVMRAQLMRLMEISRQPNVTLQIAPFDIGGLATAGGPVTVLQLGQPELPDVVYLEQLTSAVYLDERDDTNGYLQAMQWLRDGSPAPEKTVEILQRILHDSYASGEAPQRP